MLALLIPRGSNRASLTESRYGLPVIRSTISDDPS
jgi:hypothetical protein